jgi:hypothetical protein
MVRRSFSLGKYFFAFIVASVVFGLGLLLGLLIEGERVDFILSQDQEQRLDLQSIQLQYQFADQFAEQRNCDSLLKTFDGNLRDLERTRKRVEEYQKEATVNNNEFNLLKREYTLAQVNYLLLYSRTKEICNLDSATILYFFGDDTECVDCENQAIVLTWLKHKLKQKTLNFIFDGGYEQEPIIRLLKDVYHVEQYPSLVVNGKTFTGFTSRREILEEVCPHYNPVPDVCEEYV